MSTPSGFASLQSSKYLNLETFRKNGDGVRTPIWFAADPSVSLDSSAAKLYVYTIGNTGKVKRIRNNAASESLPATCEATCSGSGSTPTPRS